MTLRLEGKHLIHTSMSTSAEESIFKTGWYDLPEEWNNSEVIAAMNHMFAIREKVNQTLETPMEFDLTFVCDGYTYETLKVRPDLYMSVLHTDLKMWVYK